MKHKTVRAPSTDSSRRRNATASGPEQAETTIANPWRDLEQFFDLVPEMVVVASTDGYFKKVNPAWEQTLGYTVQELLSTPYESLIHPDDIAPTRREVERQSHGGVTINFVNRYRHKDGSYRLFEWRASPAVGNLFFAAARDISGLRRAEAALRETESQLRAVLSSAPITIFATDREGNFTLSEGKALERVGLRPGENIGVSAVDLYESLAFVEHTGEVIAGKDIVRRAFAGETVTATSELRGVSFDNHIGPLRDLDGNVAGIVGVAVDITERRLAEEALARESDRNQAFLRNASDGIHIVDIEGKVLEVSDSFCQMLGYSREELVGANVSLWDAQWSPQQLRQIIAEMIARGGHSTFETQHRRRDGSVLDVEITSHDLGLDGKRVLFNSARDITERKLAEEALRESERRYRELFDQGNEGLLIMTLDGRLSEVNRAFAEMHGYTVDELKNMDIQALDVLRERTLEDRPDVARRIQAGEVLRFEVEHYHKDGRILPLSVTASAVRLAGQLRYMSFHQDITARRRAEAERVGLEAQLQQAQRMESVGRLAGGVAHDFNNMLGVIIGHAELALEQVDPAQPLHADLEEIRKAARRSADLTRQLLAFARKQAVAPRILNLNDAVEGMLKMLDRVIGENIELKWQPGAELWPVKMDPSQIDQILANLCANARDAISGVGKMTIETGNSTLDEGYCAAQAGCEPGEYVRLAVSDDGSGMDTETVAHIFEPFFTTKGVGEGTGLGLATVYGIVKQNYGFIHVSSEVNLGTTFTIHLPRHVGKIEQAGTDGAAGPVPRGHETILLVEDEPSILTLTTRLLERQGYAVLAASTPGEAVSLAKRHTGKIDLLVTDVIMPEMNGRVLARNLLSAYPHLKRLFMSGYTADVIAHQGVLDEGVQFIQKPFSVEELATKVRDALDAPN